MDRLLREGNPPVGQLASPKPQYKKPGVDEYAPVEGQHGAPFATLKDASGNVVSPATEATLEQVRALLSGVATENKLEQARVLLNTISTKDFATQTTLAAVLAKLGQLETEIQAVKANQLSGDQKVQLSGNIELLGYEQASNSIRNKIINALEILPPDAYRASEVIYPMEKRTTEPWGVIKIPPNGAKGFIVSLYVTDITGTFSDGEGIGVDVEASTGPSGNNNLWVSAAKVKSKWARTNILWYPGVSKGDLAEAGGRSYYTVPLSVPYSIRITMKITGTFAEGEGVTAGVEIGWLV